MAITTLRLSAGVVASLVVGVTSAAGDGSFSQPAPPPSSENQQANSKLVVFPIQTLRLARHKIIAEVADTPETRERGLMFRGELRDGRGMLFIFDQEIHLAFWMKNTLIPLSIGFFSSDKALVDVQEMVPASVAESRPRSYQSSKPAKYALEMPKGWFAKNRIPIGAKLVFTRTQRSK